MASDRAEPTTKPGIFLSYTLTKAPQKEVTARVIDAVRNEIIRVGWEVIDPLKAPDTDSIRTKVLEALWRSDAAVVDVSTTVPNVMYEAGIAHGLFLQPTLMLLDASDTRDPDLETYFRFLHRTKEHPLPADLGDIEYLKYPSDLTDAAWREFIEALRRLFKDNFAPKLCSEARLLSRSTREISRRAHDFARSNDFTHPMVGFLGGRMKMMADALEQTGHDCFETDAKNYRGCLTAFANVCDDASQTVRAIADLSSPVESFWRGNADPLGARIAERLFLVSGEEFFQQRELEQLHRLLLAQSKLFAVRLGRRKSVERPQHPLGAQAVGHHLLLIDPDLTGGYVSADGEVKMRLQKTAEIYVEASQYYQEIRQQTLAFDRKWDAADLRRAWLSHEGIGRWDQEWNANVDNRAEAYFANYDLNIRCWIPGYESFIRHTAAVVEHAIAERSHVSRPVKVLEVGYGTGKLTRHLLNWIEHFNEPYTELGQERVVRPLLGVDAAARMRDLANESLEDFGDEKRLEQGNAPGQLSLAIWHEAPFDVVCGSLVLHDILDGRNSRNAKRRLAEFSKLLANDGVMVFGDILRRDDPAEQESFVSCWRAWMLETGLASADVNRFFKHNQDMLGAVSERKLRELTPGCSLEFLEVSKAPSPSWSPFCVVALRKAKPLRTRRLTTT